MASTTTTTTFSTSIYTTILADSIIHEMRPAEFMRPLLRNGKPGPSRSYDFQIFDSSGSSFLSTSAADTTNVQNYTEGTSFTSLTVTTNTARVTAAVKGTMGDVNDLLEAVSTLDARAEVTGMLGRVLSNKWEADATANLANFSNTTTAQNGTLAYDDILAAIAALEQRDATTQYAGGFHPKQLADVRADISTRVASVFVDKVDGMQGHYRQYWGNIAGVPLYASTTVGSSGGNYQGAVFTVAEALGYLEIWGPRVELWRDARALIWFIVLSQCYGTVEIDDRRGQTVLSAT